MLALSTRCAAPDEPLDRAVAALGRLCGFVALHRAPSPAESRGLVRLSRAPGIVAVHGEVSFGQALLVVEGGAADEDRERSLLELCRRLHGLRGCDVALRPARDASSRHPSPDEIELVFSEVRHVGYWHEVARAGPEYLEAGARRLKGASFHPLEFDRLGELRDMLPATAPAVVSCPPEELPEALRHARGWFRG